MWFFFFGLYLFIRKVGSHYILEVKYKYLLVILFFHIFFLIFPNGTQWLYSDLLTLFCCLPFWCYQSGRQWRSHLYLFGWEAAIIFRFTFSSCYILWFTSPTIIQDFPVRGKAVYLHICHRKWLCKDDDSIHLQTYELSHEGTQLTTEFVVSLKATNWK